MADSAAFSLRVQGPQGKTMVSHHHRLRLLSAIGIALLVAGPWVFDTYLLNILVKAFFMAIVAGLACAFLIGKALPSTMDAVSAIIEPLCADSAGSTQDVVEPIGSYALPNVPGKRVTIVRVFYGPSGFTRAHRHAGRRHRRTAA